MKTTNKRWLISKMKTSGSKRKFVENWSFSDDRNTKKYQIIDNLPNHESMGAAWSKYNHKLNYGPLFRFLIGQIGNNWDEVYSEIISRIPTKLHNHKEVIYLFVADKIELINGNPYNKKTNKFIWTSGQGEFNYSFDSFAFYVCPETNKLLRVEDKPSRRRTKSLDKFELKKYREHEKNDVLKIVKYKQEVKAKNDEITRMKITEHNQKK